jgi:uncharacterized damage-inducible protein DinB
MLDHLIKLYDRDMLKLRNEIEAFTREEDLWRTTGQITNPAGNLALHLAGNLSTYIGKNLGNISYTRDRPAEFSRRDVVLQEVLAVIDTTHRNVMTTLQALSPAALDSRYPEDALGYEMTTGYFLIHLLAHLSYHTGQINYLRRTLV